MGVVVGCDPYACLCMKQLHQSVFRFNHQPIDQQLKPDNTVGLNMAYHLPGAVDILLLPPVYWYPIKVLKY